MHGGGHERGMRSGHAAHAPDRRAWARRFASPRRRWPPRTSASACCATGCGRACRRSTRCIVNGDIEQRVPHNLNASFNFVEGESLIMAIKDIAVSSGSACTSASLEPSYVLRALGRSDELAHSSIRFTIGRFTTEADVDYTIELVEAQGWKTAGVVPTLGDAPGRGGSVENRVGRPLVVIASRRMALEQGGTDLPPRRNNCPDWSVGFRRRSIRTGKCNIEENVMAYSEKVLDHYENPRNVGLDVQGRG